MLAKNYVISDLDLIFEKYLIFVLSVDISNYYFHYIFYKVLM